MITVKEEFLSDDKTKRAIKAGGYEVLALWLAMKGYAAAHGTDGFIPDEDVDGLPGAPAKPRKALTALVECGRLQADGSRGAGLVDPVSLGWQLHDYLDHASSSDELELRRTKARIQKQKRREELKRLAAEAKMADTAADNVRTRTGPVRGQPPDNAPDREADRPRPPRAPAGGRAPARGPTRDPSPAQPSPEIPKASEVVAKEPDRSEPEEAQAPEATTTPSSFEEAVGEPLMPRAMLVQGDPTKASLLRVAEWPETIQVAAAWHSAGGRTGEPRITPGVTNALVELWAKGYMNSDVLRVARYLPTTPKFADKVLPSCLTEDVVTIALAELNEKPKGPSDWAKGIVSSVERGGAPEPLGGTLTRLAAGGGG